MNPSEVEVRALREPDEMGACVSLYESVFELGPEDGSLNPRLLVGIARNGGSVIGAFAGDELIGFTLSFLARDGAGEALYQYSQLATVARSWQGRGVGRRLKFAQRDAALAMGVREIRWAFDPFSVRNAHFNLDVLGATATELVRDLYGTHSHGLDAERTTPRLIASWALDAERAPSTGDPSSYSAPRRASTAPGRSLERLDAGAAALAAPASTFSRDASANEGREWVLTTMTGLFGEGLVATSCREDDGLVTYLFEAPARARAS